MDLFESCMTMKKILPMSGGGQRLYENNRKNHFRLECRSPYRSLFGVLAVALRLTNLVTPAELRVMEKKQAYQIPALFVPFLASLFSLILNKFQSRQFPSNYFTIAKLDKRMTVFKWEFYATCCLPTFFYWSPALEPSLFSF